MAADGSLFGDLRRLRVVDLFAGGGGASTGIAQALGVEPLVAINHDEHAIFMHQLNHPETQHHHASVFDVAPLRGARGGRVDLLWASPDCTHHSRARGGKPRETGRRALAWVVVDWARDVRPRCIALENVPEFEGWGPLGTDGMPIKARAGEEFAAFVAALRALGYHVEWRVLAACDYGAPTTRRRLYLIARCDDHPLRWPEPTHGPGRLPYHTAAEIIDWSDVPRSIFDRERPLAEATQRRIAEGIRRYVLGGSPYLLRWEGGMLAPFLATTRNGEREGQAPRVASAERPLGTVTAIGSQGALVAAFLAKHNLGVVGQELNRPLGTVTGIDHHSLAAVWLDKLHGSARAGVPVDQPHPTVTTGGGRGGGHSALVAAFLARYYGTGGQLSPLGEPCPTVTTLDRLALVTVTIDGEPYFITDIGMRMLQPRELARAHGFPDSYQLPGSKRQQVERIGNSVVVQMARAIAGALLGDEAGARRAA